MGFRFDFADKSYADYIGKNVKIVFTDGEEMICKVIGFTSAANNDTGTASVDVLCDKYDATVEISEDEIESITETE